jgi:hypothetical protein
VRLTPAIGVLGLAALGAAVFALTRDSADIDRISVPATWSWGGTTALRNGDSGIWTRFAGNGTVVVVVSALNTRDHPVELTVPDRALAGVRAQVRFRALRSDGALPDVREEADLRGTATTMPAHAEGQLIHVFRITDCSRAAGIEIRELGLETDGHDAQVEVATGSGETELARYADQALRGERLTIMGC